MSLKAAALEAIQRNKLRNTDATSPGNHATHHATHPAQTQHLSGSQCCIPRNTRECNNATNAPAVQQAVQRHTQHGSNWQQADDIARHLIERLCRAWACPPGEYTELVALYQQGRLTLAYIERLIQEAPPGLRAKP